MKKQKFKINYKLFKTVCYCLFIILTKQTIANQNKIDSIRAELNKASTSEQQELLFALANSLIQIEENDSAIKYLEQLVNTSHQFLPPLKLAEAYRNLGLLYQYKGQFKIANDNNFKGLSIKEEINAPPEALASSHSNIALTYQELEQYENAIKHQKISLKLSQKANDTLKVGERYNMIGGIYYQLEEYDTALSYYNKALEINRKLNNKKFLSVHQIYIGLIHLKKDRLFMAQQAFQKALADFPEDGGKRMKVFIYSNLAVVHLVIGAERDSVGKFNLNTCINYAEKTYTLAEELSFLRQMRKATEILYKAYDALGEFQKAVEYSKEYIVLNDSMYKEQEQKAIAEIQTKYDTEKKQAEIDFLDRENTIKAENLIQAEKLQANQKLVIILLIVGFLIIGGVLLLGYRLYLQKKKSNEELQQKNLIISNQKEEKEILLKEIHHRVKNNLQVISSLLDTQLSGLEDVFAKTVIEDSQSRVKAMALIHEKLYQNEDLGKINMQEYIQQLFNQLSAIYQSQQKVNFNLIANDISLEIDTAVPLGLILNELISNSLKYGNSANQKLKITLQLRELCPGKYLLEVADNGSGLPEEFNFQTTKTLGLRLVRRLARQLYGAAKYEYKNGATFIVSFLDFNERKKIA